MLFKIVIKSKYYGIFFFLQAFSSVGFVYIRDHGIDEEIIKSAMEASKNYFLLPQAKKVAFPRDPVIQQGYVAPGREIFDQKEDGSKVNSVTVLSGNAVKLRTDGASRARKKNTLFTSVSRTPYNEGFFQSSWGGGRSS